VSTWQSPGQTEAEQSSVHSSSSGQGFWFLENQELNVCNDESSCCLRYDKILVSMADYGLDDRNLMSGTSKILLIAVSSRGALGNSHSTDT
jgi:hypothetical protein